MSRWSGLMALVTVVAMGLRPGFGAQWCWTVRVAGELLTICSK